VIPAWEGDSDPGRHSAEGWEGEGRNDKYVSKLDEGSGECKVGSFVGRVAANRSLTGVF